VDKRPAAKEVAADRFIVVGVEQVRNISARRHVLRVSSAQFVDEHQNASNS
jgi:hypothetical protein